MAKDLDEMTLEELREEARERDVSGRSAMNKDELKAALSDDPQESGRPSTGAASEASDQDNPEVVEGLSSEGQEALEEMDEADADASDIALDASGPLHLEKPEQRIETGAVTEEQAKAQLERRGDAEVVGDLLESGPPAEKEEEDPRADDPARVAEEEGPPRLNDYPEVPVEVSGKRPRLYEQQAQLQTDGLSGPSDHNLERAYYLEGSKALNEERLEEAAKLRGESVGDSKPADSREDDEND